ncbi:helix-turn-helix domain-containing protein [Paenibacillus elgii]|uniref:helix-turn-helix domain-containing protein n=1 Tax=Paenibacillus elgii TaxID=189691 RepID=UPI0020416BE2|nr:helix-turn-helix transcriptional regulator [Paenibacillus elgii]MCM3273690.1 helix-turn-helix domain-containing protein [Paenibacillus elgii]
MNISSDRIRKTRRAKDLSGTEVAEKLNISAQYYYNIERGIRNLSAELAAGLAKIFGVSADYLLGLSDDPNSSSNVVASQSDKPYSLTPKEENDIAIKLQKMMEELESEESLAFLGEPMDEEDKELLRMSLENSLRLSKEMAKRKFTPKKYRK